MKKEVEKEFSELFAFTDKQYSEPHKINFNNNEQKIMNELEYNICQIFISIDKQSSDNLFFLLFCFIFEFKSYNNFKLHFTRWC